MSGNRWMTDVQEKIGAVARRYSDSNLPVLLKVGSRCVPMDVGSVRAEPLGVLREPVLVVEIKNFPDGALDTDGGDVIQCGAKS